MSTNRQRSVCTIITPTSAFRSRALAWHAWCETTGNAAGSPCVRRPDSTSLRTDSHPVKHIMESRRYVSETVFERSAGDRGGNLPAHPTRQGLSSCGQRIAIPVQSRFCSQFTRRFLYIWVCGADRIRDPKTVRPRRFGRRLQRPRSGAFHRPNR